MDPAETKQPSASGDLRQARDHRHSDGRPRGGRRLAGGSATTPRTARPSSGDRRRLRSFAMPRTLRFYHAGNFDAESPRCMAKFDDRIVDISHAPGLTHLRNALLEDHNFDWPHGRSWPTSGRWSHWCLMFHDPKAAKSTPIWFHDDFATSGTQRRDRCMQIDTFLPSRSWPRVCARCSPSSRPTAAEAIAASGGRAAEPAR